MKLRLLLTLSFTFGLFVFCSGCAGRTAASLSARRLSSSIQLYQSHLDAFIDQQKKLYQERQKHIKSSKDEILQLDLGNLRISQATPVAEKMIGNPDTETQPSKLTAYLKTTHQEEQDLISRLLQSNEQEKKDLEQRISVLQSKKALSEKIRMSLLQLSRKPSLIDEAKDLEGFGEVVKSEIDKIKESKPQ